MLVMLLGCLAGCMRNDPVEVYPTPTPVTTTTPDATARPTHNPNQNNDGMVNDGNGILEDNDGNAATPDRDTGSKLEDDILDNDMLDGDKNNGTGYTPAPSAATGANANGRSTTRK